MADELVGQRGIGPKFQLAHSEDDDEFAPILLADGVLARLQLVKVAREIFVRCPREFDEHAILLEHSLTSDDTGLFLVDFADIDKNLTLVSHPIKVASPANRARIIDATRPYEASVSYRQCMPSRHTISWMPLPGLIVHRRGTRPTNHERQERGEGDGER